MLRIIENKRKFVNQCCDIQNKMSYANDVAEVKSKLNLYKWWCETMNVKEMLKNNVILHWLQNKCLRVSCWDI